MPTTCPLHVESMPQCPNARCPTQEKRSLARASLSFVRRINQPQVSRCNLSSPEAVQSYVKARVRSLDDKREIMKKEDLIARICKALMPAQM